MTKFDNDELIRDHHQGEKERKGQILPNEFQTREGKCRECDDNEHGCGRYDREKQGIGEIAAERDCGKSVLIVLQGRMQREK